MSEYEYVRKLCISELNSILPMVRETIRKQRELQKREEELDEKQDRLNKVNTIMHQLKTIPELLLEVTGSTEKALEKPFQKLKQKYKYIQKQLEIEIKKDRNFIEVMNNELSAENSLYQSVVTWIKTSMSRYSKCDVQALLKEEDLKEEFLEEYIFLLIPKSSFNSMFTLESLFRDETAKVFYDMVEKSFSEELSRRILDVIIDRKADYNLFFEVFK